MAKNIVVVRKEGLKEETTFTACGTNWDKRKTISNGEIKMMQDAIEYMSNILNRVKNGEFKIKNDNYGNISFRMIDGDHALYENACKKEEKEQVIKNYNYNREVIKKEWDKQANGAGSVIIQYE